MDNEILLKRAMRKGKQCGIIDTTYMAESIIGVALPKTKGTRAVPSGLEKSSSSRPHSPNKKIRSI